ncbi:glycosyltransferase [Flavobacterium sediminis]|uniref:Glycosyltransferase n=1 Tax=Flavobacterium sediminis TaxID=2201181 RepID=A0A2U8QSH5_9FLAO|nr:glycosyltransferase [Flavobacterium sediminis]AWM13059.1 glycosyltransferase [Flavobacterium sediminis]
MKKILFIHPDLKGGGAEKVLVDLLNNLSKEKYEITLFTIFEEGVNRKNLDPAVKQYSSFKKVFRGYSVLQKIISPRFLAQWIAKDKYDIVVAYLEHVPTRIASAFPEETKKIAWLHTNADVKLLSQTFRSYAETEKAYQAFDAIVCVSDLAKKSLLKAIPTLDETKVQVIENALDVNAILEKAEEKPKIEFTKEVLNLVTIGRLVEVKGYDRLLRIVLQLKKKGFRFKLHILGEGELGGKFQKFITENELKENVVLLGFQENPYAILQQADLYICSSYNEGYNTAIIEALLLEVPVITTDCSGMTAILDDSRFGIITKNNEEALLQAVEKVLQSKEELQYWKSKAIERKTYFIKQNSVQKVENLFDSLA